MADQEIRQWEGPGLDAWRPWTPVEVAELLAGVGVPWCVVGGWAIELALDRPLRAHEDIEIAVPRRFFPRIRRRLAGYRLHVVGDGEVRALLEQQRPPRDRHQTWVLDTVENVWRMDVMREPGDAQTWIFRRDERIRAARSRMIAERRNIPYLRPEGALLFKAKAMRDKDQADFQTCLPVLAWEARDWLLDALRVVHPDHPWIARLATESS